ncbi:MAG: cytochrome c [Pseudomonadales bacterium]|nr:cytochrome c [Pseudomonadales bacterium]MDP6471008.1 cytochrome c [Pseudomonadales bacterium]MDP6970200.1 cytochrome c [Pseudomonadales bacterium]
MRTRALSSVLVVAFTALALPSFAQEAPSPEKRAENATATRQGLFKLLGFNMAPIVGMARARLPFDAATAERNARRIASLAPMIPDVLAAMDTREFDVETEALPLIWDNLDDIDDKAQNLVSEANKFADVAADGDQQLTLRGLRALGGACGNCHDAYRVDND